jgi:predicted nuclease of predicted toxin-antitoxin system
LNGYLFDENLPAPPHVQPDFSARIMLSTPPPWVVHLRVGNMRLAEFHAWLAAAWPQVERLLPAHKLLSVYADRIESVRE